MKKRNIEPKVFIVTINWNGLKDTIECLSSLDKVKYKNKEIVVVDNGSRNDEDEIIKKKFPYITLIKLTKNTGFTGGCNVGIKLALNKNADYVLLLNNDTLVESNFLYNLINFSELNQNVGLISPKILYYGTNRIWSMGGRISYLTGISRMIGKGDNSDLYSSVFEPEFISGCALLIKRKVLDSIGILDPDYFAYYEDVDYSFRAKKAGYVLKVIPDSIIWHKKSASAGVKGTDRITPLQSYLWGRNSILFAKKNLIGVQKIKYVIGNIFFKPIILLTRFTSMKSFLKYYLGLVSINKQI